MVLYSEQFYNFKGEILGIKFQLCMRVFATNVMQNHKNHENAEAAS